MKKKLDIFFTILLIIILGILLFCYSQLVIFHKDYINFCGYTVFQVITGSMSPVIEPQDIIIVKLTKDVKTNDIVTYRSGDNFVTHRIIDTDKNKLITKGDANNSQDIPITKNLIVGKVVFILEGVAIWMQVIKEPAVIASIIITIIAIRLIFFKESKINKK